MTTTNNTTRYSDLTNNVKRMIAQKSNTTTLVSLASTTKNSKNLLAEIVNNAKKASPEVNLTNIINENPLSNTDRIWYGNMVHPELSRPFPKGEFLEWSTWDDTYDYQLGVGTCYETLCAEVQVQNKKTNKHVGFEIKMFDTLINSASIRLPQSHESFLESVGTEIVMIQKALGKMLNLFIQYVFEYERKNKIDYRWTNYPKGLNREGLIKWIVKNTIVLFRRTDKVPLTEFIGKISSISQSGGKLYHSYHGRRYVIRIGSRGGKYILVEGNKIYL